MSGNLTEGDFDIASLSGEIDHRCASTLQVLGERYLEKVEQGRFDFSKVEQCDCSAVALMLGWCRYAKARNKSVVFSNIPKAVLAIIRVCALEKILPLEGKSL